MSDGFKVTPFICSGCGGFADGLPDGRKAIGLPKGWLSLVVERYDTASWQTVSSAFRHEFTVYYCSSACLPSELLKYAEIARAEEVA